MRRQIPDHKRPFTLPFGDVIPFLAFFAANMIVIWAGWDENWRLFLAVLLGFVVLAILKITDRGAMSRMDWRAGLWALPWFAGLALISFLSTFPEGPRMGNTGTIPFGWDFLVVLALSAGVWWLALSTRLPTATVEEYIEQTSAEAAEEEKELGKTP